MMSAGFLRPWKSFRWISKTLGESRWRGTSTYLVVVDRASMFLFANTITCKEAAGVSRKPLNFPLVLEVPLSIPSDARGEFTARVAKHLCQWLRVSIYYGPADPPQGGS